MQPVTVTELSTTAAFKGVLIIIPAVAQLLMSKSCIVPAAFRACRQQKGPMQEDFHREPCSQRGHLACSSRAGENHKRPMGMWAAAHTA